MSKKLYLPLLVALVAVLSSCNSKMGELSADYFTVTPQVLEAVGGQVPVTINGQFPTKYFNKRSVVTVTPVLRYAGGEAVGQPYVYQGEKVEGNDKVISYKMGGNYTMRTVFKYVPEMAKSELFLTFKVVHGKKTYILPDVKVADGVIATSELVNQTVASANLTTGEDAFQRIIRETEKRDIMFMIQQAYIRSSERKVAGEFNTAVADVDATENKKINNIEISAYASPDGATDLNTRLAQSREKNTEKLVSRNLKKSKVEAVVDTKYTAEDWEGFKELVEASNIQDKQLILRVLSMYSDPDKRDEEIKNIAAVYEVLAKDILPQLRRSRLTLNYDVIGKSDSEISELAASNAKALNLEELLYAATLTDNAATKESIYTKATQLFAQDFRAYNNLGKLAYEAGKLDKAASYFAQAKAKNASSAEVANNMGLLALAKGDKAAAQTLLGQAAGAPELKESLGNLAIATGEYDKAVASFGSAKTNSAALAQILSKDYSTAKSTLNAIATPDATTCYLKAVLGARTNNSDMVVKGLKNSIKKDPSMLAKAKNDIEFVKYAAALAGVLK